MSGAQTIQRQADSSNIKPSLHSVADVLAYARRAGVRLWSEDGQLRYKAPVGSLTQEVIEGLRRFRYQIVDSLEVSSAMDCDRPASHVRLDHAPLTFTQLAYWRSSHAHNRPALRQLASAT